MNRAAPRTPDLPALAAASQTRLDAAVATAGADYAAGGGKLWCARSCRNCCTLTVHATLPEALLLAPQLGRGLQDAVAERAAQLRQLAAGSADLKTFWRRHRHEAGPCPLLAADGACSVYPARPLACRALLSTRAPDWCATDFADLPPLDRQLYLSSLDPAVVAYPTHYLAAPQDSAAALERELLAAMRQEFGCALSGCLPVLLLLSFGHRLSVALRRGPDAARQLLAASGFDHPFLLDFSA